MNDMNKIKRLVIVGGGTAGWMAAAAFGKLLGKVLDIRLVESKEIPTIGVGEATIPMLRTFHQTLEIDELEFMKATKATFKLGIDFDGWLDKNHNYFHSFGVSGKDTWVATFHNYWLKGQETGNKQDFGEFCLEWVAARAGKFAKTEKPKMNYGYHLDASLYAKFLRKHATAQNVKRTEGTVEHVNCNKDNGHIESLVLKDGEVIEGDFFIDCTGFKALLIEETLHSGFEDWSHWLPCDSAVAMQTETVGEAMPYTLSATHDAGWRWKIPLQHRMGNGLLYSSKNISDEDAIKYLKEKTEGKPLHEPKVFKFRPGIRRKSWNKNCVAMGFANGFIDALESTSIHQIQRSIFRLVQMFPVNGVSQADEDEYNLETRAETDLIRDFVILHYKVTNRRDTPFWRRCESMEIPEDLERKIRLFKETGRIFRDPKDLFAETSWQQVLIGLDVIPKQYNAIVDIISDEENHNILKKLSAPIKEFVDKLPTHEEFLKQYCMGENVVETKESEETVA